MGFLKWCLGITIVFFAGYFTHTIIEEKVSAPISHIDTTFKYENNSVSAINKKANSTTSDLPEKEKIKNIIPPETTVNNAQAIELKKPTDQPKQSEINNQNDGNLLPKPYDEMLQRIDAPLREKYKAFADKGNNHKDEWDVHMQSKITDFILSRPSATDIKIDSVNCNSTVCEIRLQEQKRFLLMATFAELLQEPWIINTSTGQFNFIDNYGYMLLMRK